MQHSCLFVLHAGHDVLALHILHIYPNLNICAHFVRTNISTVLFCTVPSSTILYRMESNCTVKYSTPLYCTVKPETQESSKILYKIPSDGKSR